MPKQGIATGIFGKQLYDYCKKADLPFDVYYDHGDKNVDPNVAATKGFFGKTVSNLNRLADVDVIVGLNDKAVLLIEIEERPISPKKILGDAFAIMMCNKFAVKVGGSQITYDVDEDTKLMLACSFQPKGHRLEKTQNLIDRLQIFEEFNGGIVGKNICLIYEIYPQKLIDKLRIKVIDYLHSTLKS